MSARRGGNGGNPLDNKEQRTTLVPVGDKDSRIELVVNRPPDEGGREIDLARVFRNMKLKLRVFAWVILFCFALGLCVPLLMYQFNKARLTVSSVVTLRYPVIQRNSEGQIVSNKPVTDLTAPDGGELDLGQITSSYVLKAALDGLELSKTVSLASLRNNIRVKRILSEDSRRQQEIASKMISDKSSGAYAEAQSIQLTYTNQFVVSLTNGFGSGSRSSFELTDSELRLVLDRVLAAYNEYLVTTYADTRMPDDEFAAIDAEKQDILESLDLMRTAVQDLYDFCDRQPANVKSYRSWNSGITLNDLMAELETVSSVNVEYFYSYASTNSIVRERDAMVTSYQYQLRSAQNKLDALNENIATNQEILDSYKNDEIFVSMQESDSARSTRTTTDYYNRLILEQADNYDKAAKLETTIADLQYKLDSLKAAEKDGADEKQQQAAAAELEGALRVCRRVYAQIREQLEEIYGSAFFTSFAQHTVPQGKTAGFLSTVSKKLLTGGAAGLVVGCGLWFFSALAVEFRVKKDDEDTGRGAEA